MFTHKDGIEFLEGKRPDHVGRFINDYLEQDDYWWEVTHDFIQWAFPLPEKSRFNANAPLMDFSGYGLKKKEVLENFNKLLDRYLKFLDIEYALDQYPDATIFPHNKWLTPHNHNYCRLTRVIKCLYFFGRVEDARALTKNLFNIACYCPYIDRKTLLYWASTYIGFPDDRIV